LISEADTLSFDGETRLEVDVPPSLKATTNNRIVFRFKTREANGLLMSTWSRSDHLMVEIQNKIIVMSIDLGGGKFLLILKTTFI
jgi:Laminin G domain.